MNKTCTICNKEFEGHPNSKMCKRCSIEKNGTFNDLVEYDISVLDGLTEGVDYVRCEICGFYSKDLSTHISQKGGKNHNIRTEDYLKLYPNAKILCDKVFEIKSQRMSGENNIAYGHGGSLSPWSNKNTRLTEEEIEKYKKKAVKSREDNHSNTTTLQYWINKCNGDETLAREKLKERQTTFSLEKCIKKYGDIEGKIIWKERQYKWQKTMNEKPEQEKLEINRKKISDKNISKAEQELFNIIKEQFINAKQQFSLLSNDNRVYMYDITVGNKIIEYNGDYWHCKGTRFTDENMLVRFSKTGNPIYVKDIRKRDEDKLKVAKDNGYDVLIVWESDYKNNKTAIIEQCINFLKN